MHRSTITHKKVLLSQGAKQLQGQQKDSCKKGVISLW